MITAHQAKALYDESGHEVELFLQAKVEPEIVKAARSGKRNVIIYLGSLEPYKHLSQEVTATNTAVVNKLRDLGFSATIKLYGDSYVPRGLADDEGMGPRYTNYGIEISW